MNRVLVQVAHPSGRRWGAFLKRNGLAFLRTLELEGCELSVAVVDDAAIQSLNRRWRRKNRPTDVLSFPLDDVRGSKPRLLGDVVVSLDTARRQAKALGERVQEEMALYLAHGLLHLLGYDHHRAGPKRRMAALEAKLLGRAGMLRRADD